jgi:predicted aspartyl protease
MIIGKFLDRKIILPVRFLLSPDTILSIEFVVDTGFNNALAQLTENIESLISIGKKSRSFYIDRNCWGEISVYLRKHLAKWLGLAKPQSAAISTILCSGCLSNDFDRSST